MPLETRLTALTTNDDVGEPFLLTRPATAAVAAADGDAVAMIRTSAGLFASRLSSRFSVFVVCREIRVFVRFISADN